MPSIHKPIHHHWLLIFLIAALASFDLQGQITGNTNVNANSTHTYQINKGVVYPSPNWIISGGTLQSSWNIGTTYYVSAKWDGATSNGTVVFTNSGDFLYVAIASVAPPKPGNPTISSTGCGQSTLQRSGSPPSGVTWYWQGKNSNGTSTNKGSGSTFIANEGDGTYYIRARNSSGQWSSGSGSRYVNIDSGPFAPTVTGVANNCGNTVLTRGTPPSGETWYWQSSTSGTSTSNSSTTITRTSGTKYYLRSRNSNGCWSTATIVNYTVNTAPSTPSSPSVTNNCGNTVLTRGTPPSGITWYWQSSSSGTSTANSSSSNIRTTGTTYYLRARNNGTGCWSTARTINYSINNKPSTPSTPSVTNNCGSTVLTRSTPPSGTTWYWQSSSSGTSISNSSSSITRTSGTVYYLRARNNSNGCWSSSRTVNYTVNTLPGTPSTPNITNNCGSTVLTRSGHPSGITLYWQSSSSGTSTSNSSLTVTRTSGTVYYLRGRNNTTGCWSSTRTVNYTINNVPSTPAIPSVTNNCDNTVLTRGIPSSGITWYWQSSASGTSTSNSSTTVTRTSGSAYYIRARNNSSGCWGSARTINYTVDQPAIWYADNDGDGKGNASSSTSACTQPSGYVSNSSDHDDTTVMITDIAPQTFYSDVDGDGFGVGSPTILASFRPLGYANNSSDQCPDTPGTVNGCDYIAPTLSDENYVYTRTYQEAMTSASNIKSNGDVIEGVAYFDGLGRAKQQVAIRASGTATRASSPNAPAEWTMDWTEGMGSTGFFNRNGEVFENKRFYGPNPFGETDLIWRCGNDPTSHADGGWNTDYINVDRTKTYRYMVWVRRDGSQNGSTYHGTQNVNNLNGSANGNPYFWSGDLPQLGQWYLLVGIIHPYTHGSTDTGVSGVYDINGNQVIDRYEYKWRSDTTTSRFRSYFYYSTDVNTRQYFYRPILEIVDGNEIPLQEMFRAGNAEDIVTHVGYDDYGRQDKEWLPYHEPTGSFGSYRGDVSTATQQYYLDNFADDFPGLSTANVNAYSQKDLEPSPLNRVLEQGAPGKDWKLGSGHGIRFDHAGNAANEVRHYKVTLSFSNNTYTPTLVADGHYGVNELYKNVVKDENWSGGTEHTTEEFTDKQGRVVLKRTYAGVGSPSVVEAHDTYYVYDGYGNLSYVLPPKVVHDSSISATELSELCYQYVYDHRNRLVEKKIPGKGWEYIVYDKLDRPIMTQDANLDAQDKWLFTKYDAFGRVAYTGLSNTTTSSRTALQTTVNGLSTYHVTKSSSSIVIAGTTIYYNNGVYPTGISEIHTINYYDDYVFDRPGLSLPVTVLGQTTTLAVKGLATGTKVRVLDTNNWITTMLGYDLKNRSIWTKTTNNYLNTTDLVESKLDFGGKVLETKSTHTKGSDPAIVTTDNFTYDHMGRLLKQEQTIGSTIETLVENHYDGIGQLVTKETGGGLQTVDYNYNVRGWLKEINDPNNLGTDLFAFKINYNDPTNFGANENPAALFNGNISQVQWKTASTNGSGNPVSERYSFGYDALNRIVSAHDNTGNYNVTGIGYDKNGNIGTLQRQGHTNSGATSFGAMDNLAYTYDSGNKLTNVADNNASDTYGFKDVNGGGTEYVYDQNGNLTSDANKGITAIAYNHLNLPTSVTLPGGTISYIYDAAGTKIKKTVGGSLTEYAGNYIYENGSLQFFNHPDGYAYKEGSNYKYVYQYKDHLGNVRLSYSDADGNGSIDPSNEIIEESNYYPFGLEHKGYNNVVNGVEYNYKTYQGQEWHEDLGLNLHEWKYRFSDPAIGRFISIDPLAEDYRYNGVYNFAENRVIDGNELEGLEWQPVNADGNNVAPNSDQIANYQWAGYDYSMTRGTISTKGFVTEGITSFKMTPKEGTVADGAIQGNNSAGTEGATFFSVDDNKFPVKEFSELSSKSLSFAGSMETYPNNANKEWASGEVTLTSTYENGKTLTDKTWSAISGPWGNGSLENGDYTTSNLRDNRTGSYANHGVGFTFDVNPTFTTGRDLLRFHPDGGTAGTLGCIGLTCGATGLRDFRTRVSNYLNNNTNISVNVNITNNPNNNGN